MTIMHTCTAHDIGGQIEYTCDVPGCGWVARSNPDMTGFHTVAWSTMPGARHVWGRGGLTMAPPEVRQDAGPIPEDYALDWDVVRAEIEDGRDRL